MTQKTFGAWIYAWINREGIQQKDLALQVDVSPQFINDVIHGRRVPSRDIVLSIANVLDADSAWLCVLAGHLPPEMDNIDQEALQRGLRAMRSAEQRSPSERIAS